MTRQPNTLFACTSAAFFMDGLRSIDADALNEAWSEGTGSGQLELVQEMVQYAPFADAMCDREFKAREDGFPGVFDYEVSVGFGRMFGEYVIESGESPDKEMAERWLTELMADFLGEPEPVAPKAKFSVGQKVFCKSDDCIRRVTINEVHTVTDSTSVKFKYKVTCTETVGYKAHTAEAWEWFIRADASEFYKDNAK
jgi:hypothetical protein